MMYYVYVYYDPRKDPIEPIYVGKGHGRRMYHHLTKAKNPILRRKLAHIQRDGLAPIIKKVAENLEALEAMLLEQDLILRHGRLKLGTGTLCNLTEGGEGAVGFRHRPETKALLSKQRQGAPQTEAQYQANCARRHTPEGRAKISKATKGHHWHTEQQIAVIRATNATRVISEETRALWSSQRRGRKLTPAHIQKVQETKARNLAALSSEEREALSRAKSEAHKGKRRSEATKARMREAWVRRKARQSKT